MTRSDGCLKVGRSKNPERRVRSVRNGPVRLTDVKLVAKFPHPQASAVERASHFVLNRYHEGEEWFAVSLPRAVAAIECAIGAVDQILTHPTRKQGDLRLVYAHLERLASEKAIAIAHAALREIRTLGGDVGKLADRALRDMSKPMIEGRLGPRRAAQKAYAEDLRRQVHALKVAEANRGRRKYVSEGNTDAG